MNNSHLIKHFSFGKHTDMLTPAFGHKTNQLDNTWFVDTGKIDLILFNYRQTEIS